MTSPQPLIDALLQQLTTVVLGKDEAVRQALTCLLADGHLLIEDVPGVGKTTLAQALARTLGLRLARVQFTADLLPSDVVGASVWDRERRSFVFHPGPVFADVLLADEINRASPRTQSALLEAMEERQVTVDGVTHPLPQPFFVIATQNPLEQVGTQPLPESQLDRFLMRLSLGYPDAAAERALLRGQDRRELLSTLPALTDAAGLRALQHAAAAVGVADALLDTLQALLHATRSGGRFAQGLSPRAGLALLRAARAYALLQGRAYVAPDDLYAVVVPVAAHRLRPAPGVAHDSAALLRALLQELG
ncbi:MAG: AAA family ATPase [Tepidimonas ignava]|uniref:Holliday junction ATP-dependent DNA helicase RuvB n=1 Tax=Tepidimonas ignava TaxID=114249 RepID=A0A4R3LJ43_9BURK|nr:AAA family ATPase [Tepidimonas ignava]MCX7814390.1 AAA family ATPase [Tepidimonas ignava]TCS99498.1 MoxR-like ATPase [Tepidimonas ignava]TSE21998.1 Holliday junction ATP-dependent DNA helicase RuvB [Tepidimonas ignava]